MLSIGYFMSTQYYLQEFVAVEDAIKFSYMSMSSHRYDICDAVHGSHLCT